MGTRISRRRTTILVLSADSGLIRLARSILEPARVVIGRAPLDADADIRSGQVDIVVLDERIDQNVISTIRRAYPDARIIALSHESREADCVAILDADADYLPRPFRPEDLAARVRVAEVRRFNTTGRPRTYRNGLLAFDRLNRRLAIDGRRVVLSPSELALLSLLAAQPGAVVLFKPILAELGLDCSERSRKTLRSHVLHLRRKIERDPIHPEILLAEAGVGYRLAEPTESPPHHRARDSLSVDREGDDHL